MICVIGDVILDSYISGDVERISPEAPVPVVKQNANTFRLGGAANVANILASNDFAVTIISSVYDDDAGHQIIQLCNAAGIETYIGMLSAKTGQTPHKTRIVANNQQICRVDKETQSNASSKEIIANFIVSPKPEICILSDYGKGVLKDLSPIIHHLLDQKIKILVDPKDPNIEKYSGVYLVKPNLNEFKKFLSSKEIILEKNSIESLRKA